MGGITTLSSEWLASPGNFEARRLLEAMKKLHSLLCWEDLVPYLRRSKRAAPGEATDPPRDLVHCTKRVVRGCLRLREGLGNTDLPYADGVTASTPAPASTWDNPANSWDNPANSGSARREPRRVTPQGRGRALAPTGGRGALSPYAVARVSLPLPFEFLEQLPDSVAAGIRGRTAVPPHLARELGLVLPSLGASLYDASMETALLATLDTLGWVTRRVSDVLAQPPGDNPRRQLAAGVTRLAVGHEFVQRLATYGQRLSRPGGSSPGSAWVGSGSEWRSDRGGYPSSVPSTSTPQAGRYSGPYGPQPGYDHTYPGPPDLGGGPSDRMSH